MKCHQPLLIFFILFFEKRIVINLDRLYLTIIVDVGRVACIAKLKSTQVYQIFVILGVR